MPVHDSGYDEELIGYLLSLLPPAPRGWVCAAQELPTARVGLDEIVARAELDAEFRDALIADLESALAAAGLVPEPVVLDALRQRYSQA